MPTNGIGNMNTNTEENKYIETLHELDRIEINTDTMSPPEYREHIRKLEEELFDMENTVRYLEENKPTVFGYNVRSADIVISVENGYILSKHKKINGVNQVLFINDYISRNADTIAKSIVNIDIGGVDSKFNEWARNKVIDQAVAIVNK